MLPWKGSEGNIAWEVFGHNPYDGTLGINSTFDGYSISIRQSIFGKWTAVGRFYPHNGASTKIKVKVPDGYNAQNANVYLAYEGEKYLLAQLYSYDAAGKHFTEPDGFVPVGKAVHAIFVSESGGKFAYGIKTATIKANDEITFAHKDLATIEPDDLAKKVNDLK